MTAEEFYKSDQEKWWVSDDPQNWEFADAYASHVTAAQQESIRKWAEQKAWEKSSGLETVELKRAWEIADKVADGLSEQVASLVKEREELKRENEFLRESDLNDFRQLYLAEKARVQSLEKALREIADYQKNPCDFVQIARKALKGDGK